MCQSAALKVGVCGDGSKGLIKRNSVLGFLLSQSVSAVGRSWAAGLLPGGGALANLDDVRSLWWVVHR